jgi:hypothetical protein
MLSRLRSRLTYANLIATLALFVALGGTGYAAFSLPRDSVGAREIRARAVGRSELRQDAVSAEKVKDASLELRDFSRDARTSLKGERGPAGPKGTEGATGAAGPRGEAGKSASTHVAIVNAFGVRYGGTATAVDHQGVGTYLVAFSDSVAGCGYSTTLAQVQGDVEVPPHAGRVTVADEDGKVRVRTYGIGGVAEDIGFHLIVVC